MANQSELRNQSHAYKKDLKNAAKEAKVIRNKTTNQVSNNRPTPPLANDPDDALKVQNVSLRNVYINAISKNINSQPKFRKFFIWFYSLYVSVVSIFIFFVVIDPVAIYRGVRSYYPVPIKEILLGAFIANVLSVLIIMINYSFESSKSIEQQFKNVGRINQSK